MGPHALGGSDPAGFDFAGARRQMVDEQLVPRGIHDPRVLEAMAVIPRHLFVDPGLWPRAYGDHALPTVEGQTISQPYIVALMLQLAQVEADHRVLEIGTGSGYQTSLLASLADRVFSVERVPDLLDAARARLDQLAITNVALRQGDGSLGWRDFGPYARVLVTAAAPRVPRALLEQVGEQGILVIPVGGPRLQYLEVWRRGSGGQWEHARHGECRFVPLVGRDAWDEPPGPHE